MGRRTSTAQTTSGRGQPTDPGSGHDARDQPQTQEGAALKLPVLLAQTLRHFFPDFNAWLDQLPDPRLKPLTVYPARFLAWWGICLYLFRLGSRRQLDFDLSADGRALDNLNRLAGTTMTTRPVHDTLDYFLGRSGPAGLARLRQQMIVRLIRMKVLEQARIQGRYPVAIDGA